MRATPRIFTTLAAAVLLTAPVAAQTRMPGLTVVPGSGMLDAAPPPVLPAPPVPTPGVSTPLLAENLAVLPANEGPWFVVAPYAWVPGMKGTIGANGRQAGVDMSVRDAIDHISDLKGAAQLHVETGIGPWGVIADLTYLRIEPRDNTIRVDSRTVFAELLGMYRVWDTGNAAGGMTLDLLAGVRYYRFRNEIVLQPIDLTPVNKTTQWIDPVVGVRVGYQLVDHVGIFARGDLGGFDLGKASKLSSNVTVGFEYKCSDCISVLGGYRWLKIDRTQGGSIIDVTMSGPFVALGFKF